MAWGCVVRRVLSRAADGRHVLTGRPEGSLSPHHPIAHGEGEKQRARSCESLSDLRACRCRSLGFCSSLLCDYYFSLYFATVSFVLQEFGQWILAGSMRGRGRTLALPWCGRHPPWRAPSGAASTRRLSGCSTCAQLGERAFRFLFYYSLFFFFFFFFFFSSVLDEARRDVRAVSQSRQRRFHHGPASAWLATELFRYSLRRIVRQLHPMQFHIPDMQLHMTDDGNDDDDDDDPIVGQARQFVSPFSILPCSHGCSHQASKRTSFSRPRPMSHASRLMVHGSWFMVHGFGSFMFVHSFEDTGERQVVKALESHPWTRSHVTPAAVAGGGCALTSAIPAAEERKKATETALSKVGMLCLFLRKRKGSIS